MSAAIDASALLALLYDEPGAAKTSEHLRRGMISAVNLSEVFDKVRLHEGGVARTLALLKNYRAEIVPFDDEQARAASDLQAQIGKGAVSLADRACLALARTRNVPAVTADRAWSDLKLEESIVQIRGAVQ